MGTLKLNQGAQIEGDVFSGRGTVVPYPLISTLTGRALPVTISGTNNVTFTLNASKTEPVTVWAGNDLIHITKAEAYTWVVGNNDILNSTGVKTTQTASVAGVWYFYAYIDGSDVKLIPSQTAPRKNDLLHPGTSVASNYAYVGYHVCTTAGTPAIFSGN